MEQIAFNLHTRSVLTWGKLTTPRIRRALESLILLGALGCFGTIFCLHGLYSGDLYESGSWAQNCLNVELADRGINITKLTQDDVFPVIRIHISDESMLSEEMIAKKDQLYQYFEMWRAEKDFVGDDGMFSSSTRPSSLQRYKQGSSSSFWDVIIKSTAWSGNVTDKNTSDLCTGNVCSSFDGTLLDEFLSKQKVYLFSFEKGSLFLPPERREKLHIPTIDVKIAKDHSCLGPKKASWLLDKVLGYDTVAVQWCLHSLGPRGQLYNVFTKQMIDLATALPQPSDCVLDKIYFKVNAVGCTIFLFFCMSTLVSFTLRETQERMVRFTYLLQHHIRHELPIFALVFTYVVESLLFVPVMVGLHFFMRQFFLDQLLSFIVISLVWCAEVFSVVSLRTAIAANFFPRVFAIYLSFFLLYFFHFPRGYSLLAILTTVLFTFHAMLYCMNTLEIPAFDAGLISEQIQRESLISRSRESPESNAESTPQQGGDGSPGAAGAEGPGGTPHTPPRNRRVATRMSAELTASESGTSALDRVSAEPAHVVPHHKRTPENERRRKAANELLALRQRDATLLGSAKRPKPPFFSVNSAGAGAGADTASSQVRRQPVEGSLKCAIPPRESLGPQRSDGRAHSACSSPRGVAWFLGMSSDSDYRGSRSPSKDPSDPDAYSFW